MRADATVGNYGWLAQASCASTIRHRYAVGATIRAELGNGNIAAMTIDKSYLRRGFDIGTSGEQKKAEVVMDGVSFCPNLK